MAWHFGTTDDLKKFGNNVRNLRLERKLDIDTVAEAIDLAPELLIKLEEGRYPDCKMEVLFNLVDFYGISGEELFR